MKASFQIMLNQVASLVETLYAIGATHVVAIGGFVRDSVLAEILSEITSKDITKIST